MLTKLISLLLLITPTLAAPWKVPHVRGVDQSPTLPKNYGVCTAAVESSQKSSNWCKFNKLGSYPAFPNAAARKSLKFGRQTQYIGSIFRQKFACNVLGQGSNEFATVAVSTKYLKTWQGGWAKDKGACGKKVCIHVLGGDDLYNKGLQKHVVDKYRGLTFMGRVADRGAEMSDDAIDILQERPYTYAPNTKGDNPNAWRVNRLNGLRAFTNPRTAQSVGVWTALWQFVPDDWNHDTCARFMNSFGYKTWTPKWTPGVTRDL